MKTTPWLDSVKDGATYPQLDRDVTADVVVVGAGLAGTLTAYALSKEGKKVVLIDKGTIEDMTTAYTTAFITRVIDDSLTRLVAMYGETKARLIWKSGQESIDHIEEIIRTEKIDCEFTRLSEYILALSSHELQDLKEEADTAIRSGFDDVSLHTEKTFPFDTLGYLLITNQAAFNPIRFIVALRERFVANGGVLYEKTEAQDIKELNDRVVVTTPQGTITAQQGVITTYKAFNKPRELFAHMAMYTSYVFEVELATGTVPEGLYLDQANPYHYFWVAKGTSNDRMLIGGEDHRADIPLKPEISYAALEGYLQKLFPKVSHTIIRRWDGGILESIDGLPYIGRFSKKTPLLFVATGFSGSGIHYSMLSAQIITDLIMKRDNSYAALYDAGRKTTLQSFIRESPHFIGEFFGGAVRNLVRSFMPPPGIEPRSTP